MTVSRLPSRSLFSTVWFVAAALWLVGAGDVAVAQRKKKTEIPEMQRVTVNSKDGVAIRCNYYPGGVVQRRSDKKKDETEYSTRPGKEVVPIIMLHGWEGRRGEYDFLASYLQRKGHAVIVPDLRGHGDSKTVRLAGGNQEIRLRPNLLRTMILDVDAVKKFLLNKNNEAELNIEMLCVVGAESGAIVAVNWAEHDWNWRQLPSFKQGRDVKALVLLSPEQTFKGVTMNRAIQHPVVRSALSIMIIAGQRDRSRFTDAKAIHNRLQRFHPEVSDRSEQDLYLLQPDAGLHGTQLVDQRVQSRLPVAQNIGVFIDWRLVRKGDVFQWQERKSPLGAAD